MTPDEFTNREFFLDVGDGHSIYVHDWGNPGAKVAIFHLHGGPGNGCDDSDKKKFDPKTQRVVFHDQRGSGKSTPAGSLDENNTGKLIGDIDKIRQELALEKVILVGGSWGSTLSLVYAIEHPENVAGMVIDGIFTASKAESDWLEKGGWRQFFPEVWEEYAASVPEANRDNPTAYHMAQIEKGSPEEVKKSSYVYLKMELALLKLDDVYLPKNYADFDPAGGKVELHYLKNGCFLPENYISDNASKLQMPVRIIQGRYDMVCPPATAYELHKALPDSEIAWTINGHLRQHEAKNIQKIFIKQLLEQA